MRHHDGRVRLSEVRDVMKLIAGLERRWADSHAWRRHLLRGMRRLFDAQLGMWVETAGVNKGGRPQAVEMTTTGWTSSRARRRFTEYVEMGGPAQMPDFRLIAKRIVERGHYTGRRRDHIPDATWYASAVYREYMPGIGLDDYVVSMRVLPPLGTTSSLSVHRAVGAMPFTAGHRRLLALLHAELAPRIGTRLALQRQRGLHGLNPRQRQTLRRLLRGESEKQIAKHFGVQPTTVHGYVRELHTYFKVHSRAALLAYFLHQRPRPTAPKPGGAAT